VIPEGNKPFGKPRIRWEENISKDIEKFVWKGVNWDDLTQDRNNWPGFMNNNNNNNNNTVIYILVQ
jgi:hypothetical protein